MPRRARFIACHRFTTLLAIALLLAQFVAPVLHDFISHSAAPISAQHGPGTAVSASSDHTDAHDPSTCAICQSIHQHRAGFAAPPVTAWVESSAFRFVSNGAQSFVTPRPCLSSAPPRGPPVIA